MEKMTLKEEVIDIIDQLRPFLQQDGGDIQYLERTEDNVVKVKLQGACGSCPHAKITLKNGVESTIKKYIPEIHSVVDESLGL